MADHLENEPERGDPSKSMLRAERVSVPVEISFNSGVASGMSCASYQLKDLPLPCIHVSCFVQSL